jgi:hypothetical protein
MSLKQLPASSVQQICEKLHLASLEVLNCNGPQVIAQGMRLVELSCEELGSLSGVYMEIPVEVNVTLLDEATIGNLRCPEITQEDMDEAVSHLRRLAAQGRIVQDSKSPAPGATHEIKTDAQGRRIVVRRCYH